MQPASCCLPIENETALHDDSVQHDLVVAAFCMRSLDVDVRAKLRACCIPFVRLFWQCSPVLYALCHVLAYQLMLMAATTWQL